MRVCIFYNGTDSNFDHDISWDASDTTNRFRAGEIVSRLSHTVDYGQNQVLQVDGVGGMLNGGTLLGMGLEANVQLGRRFWETRMRQLPSGSNGNVLIICGWSRGGITALCLARAVCDYLDSAGAANNSWEIKVMTFDPVAGKGANWEGSRPWYKLNRRVKEYVGFYAREELSPGFETTIPSRENVSTKMTLIDVASFHSSLVGSVTETINGGVDAAAARVYGKVKNRAMATLKDDWKVPFDDLSLNRWESRISSLRQIRTVNTMIEAAELRERCAKHSITSNRLIDGLGRGVFVGNNSSSRKWIRTSSLDDFLKMDNHVALGDGIRNLHGQLPLIGQYIGRAKELIIDKITPSGVSTENFSCEMIDGCTD